MRLERVLLDIETQQDFFQPGGSCYRRPASRQAKAIYRLFRWARQNEVPVISTVLRVRPGERGPLAAAPHCREGTEGERKLLRTVLPRRINLGLRGVTDVPADLFERYQQVIFEKRHTDTFRHPAAERLITDIEEATFVICGAGVAHGIAEAAIGLRERGFGVIVAGDAVLHLGHRLAPMAFKRMDAKGVVFVPTDKIVSACPVSAREARRVPLHLTDGRAAG